MTVFEYMDNNGFMTFIIVFAVTICWGLLVLGVTNTFTRILNYRIKIKKINEGIDDE